MIRNLSAYCLLILLIAISCRHSAENKSTQENRPIDSSGILKKNQNYRDSINISRSNARVNKSDESKSGVKEVEVEIKKLNPRDTSHKMSLFAADRKYFHNDSLYCEMLYKLKEVQSAAKEIMPEGDYISMMIDDRPAGQSHYYQIALYRIRAKLEKMDRIDSYRINNKTKLIEKHDMVRDKWIPVN
jgi:hypothetical protein